MKEYDEHEKKHRNRTRKAKKAKKDSVHLTSSKMETTQNIQVFPEVSPNPISESGEPLFFEENLKVFPNSPSIINPRHPCAKYFKALIESLNLDNNKGYLNDPSLDINHHTDKLSRNLLIGVLQALRMMSPPTRTPSATSLLLRLDSAVSHSPWLPLDGQAL
jgi:hypothetical protein